METIALTRADGGWLATHSDPTVRDLFGTDTLPLPFTAEADETLVRDTIERLNPGVLVVVAPVLGACIGHRLICGCATCESARYRAARRASEAVG